MMRLSLVSLLIQIAHADTCHPGEISEVCCADTTYVSCAKCSSQCTNVPTDLSCDMAVSCDPTRACDTALTPKTPANTNLVIVTGGQNYLDSQTYLDFFDNSAQDACSPMRCDLFWYSGSPPDVDSDTIEGSTGFPCTAHDFAGRIFCDNTYVHSGTYYMACSPLGSTGFTSSMYVVSQTFTLGTSDCDPAAVDVRPY